MSNQIQKQTNVKSWLTSDSLREQISAALPEHCTPDRFMRVVNTAMQKNPKLLKCSQPSLFNAFQTCSELGIEPDGRRAHLIPYGDNCQLIIDYKGLVELALRSGKISTIHSDVICENDTFIYDRGQVKEHIIDFKNPRGEMYAVYATAIFKDGGEQSEVMTKDEVEAIRNRSRAGNSGPWKTDFNEMAKKTVFRRLSKWLPLSPEIMDKIAADDTQFDKPKMQVAEPVLLDPDEEFDLSSEPPVNEESEGEVVTSEEAVVEEEKPARKRRTKEQIENDNVEELAKLLIDNEIHRDVADAWAKSIGKDLEDPVFIKEILSRPAGAVEQMKSHS